MLNQAFWVKLQSKERKEREVTSKKRNFKYDGVGVGKIEKTMLTFSALTRGTSEYVIGRF